MTTYEPADWRPEPGDVAMVTYDGSEFVRVMDRKKRWWGSGDGFLWTENLKNVRRLFVTDRDPASTVVLDPELAGDIGAVTRAMVDAVGHSLTFAVAETVLRSLLPVTTPPEPNGLGAVVVDADDEWVLVIRAHEDDGTWRAVNSGDLSSWLALTNPDVVSHGWRCTCGAPDCNGAAALTGEES